jgi:hypothetical protein
MNRLRNISSADCIILTLLRFFLEANHSGWSVRSYLGLLLASFFLISGLSYKTTFNKELRISSFPLYSM